MFAEGGDTGVCLFFVLSGYCLTLSQETESYGRFLAKRLLRLLPAYYLAIAVWVWLVSIGVAVKPVGVKDIVSHMLFLHVFSKGTFYSVSGVFWFLGILFQMYLLAPVFKAIGKRGWLVGMSSALVPYVLCLGAARYFNVTTHVLTKSLFSYAPCFMFGVLSQLHPFTIRFRAARYALLLATFALLLINFPVAREISRVVKSCLLTLSLLQIGDDIQAMPKCLADAFHLVAKSSYSIFLYNYIFYAYKPITKNGLVMLCSVALVFGFGIMMHFFTERPLKRLLGTLGTGTGNGK